LSYWRKRGTPKILHFLFCSLTFGKRARLRFALI